ISIRGPIGPFVHRPERLLSVQRAAGSALSRPKVWARTRLRPASSNATWTRPLFCSKRFSSVALLMKHFGLLSGKVDSNHEVRYRWAAPGGLSEGDKPLGKG